MTEESPTIEVEVLEIDGTAPPTTFETPRDSLPRQPWQFWLGRIRKLDRRWWPLWAVLGTAALVVLLTLGVVIGFIAVVYKILKTLLNAVIG